MVIRVVKVQTGLTPLDEACRFCVLGGDGGGNAVHYLQSTLTVRIPGSQRTVETAALDGEIGQSRTPC